MASPAPDRLLAFSADVRAIAELLARFEKTAYRGSVTIDFDCGKIRVERVRLAQMVDVAPAQEKTIIAKAQDSRG